MWYVYVDESYFLALLSEHRVAKQIIQHSKHEKEHDAEAVAQELERLGYSVWIEREGVSSDG